MRLRATIRMALYAVAVALAGQSAAAQAPVAPEYAVKAAFLYKFGPFVEWPAAAFDNATSPFVVCVVGDDPFGVALDQIVGQRVGQHPVALRRLARVERGGGGCHVVYAAGSKAQPAAQVLAAVQGAPVLTVTDESRGDGSRGMIHFVLQASRVRFHIDARTAAQDGLSISSKLLSLALSVKEAGQ